MRILPKEPAFFELYEKQAAKVVEAAEYLARAAESLQPNWFEVENYIHELESQCDEFTHELIERLHGTFITPLDPEDIHDLAVRLDDILDAFDHLVTRIAIYRLATLPELGKQICAALLENSRNIEQAVRALGEGGKLPPLLSKIQEQEDKIDRLHRNALEALVASVTDPIEFVKLRDFYDHLEATGDCLEGAAHVIRRAVLKNA